MRVPIRLGGIGFVPAPGHGPLVQSLRLRMETRSCDCGPAFWLSAPNSRHQQGKRRQRRRGQADLFLRPCRRWRSSLRIHHVIDARDAI